jgi:hypothetical protein
MAQLSEGAAKALNNVMRAWAKAEIIAREKQANSGFPRYTITPMKARRSNRGLSDNLAIDE